MIDTWIIRIVVFICVVFATVTLLRSDSQADYHIVDLKELSIDYKNYQMVNPNSHNMLIWPNVPKEGINVGIKLDVLNYLYWDSVIESLTDSAQYASIGLDTRLGVRLSDHLDVGVYHHSQHVLDSSYVYMNGHFPEEDAVEVKIYLYKQNNRESLF